MSRFFPTPDLAREARETYAEATMIDALAVVGDCGLEKPREFDIPEMLDELADLLTELDVPDRDGIDFAVIVPATWNGTVTRATVTLDFGRRLLQFINHPQFGSGPIPQDLYLVDLEFPSNLRKELLAALITYKNPHV